MARRAGGGKYCVEGCRFVDALDLRRKGHLQPPPPGKPPYAITPHDNSLVGTNCAILGSPPMNRAEVIDSQTKSRGAIPP